VLERIVDGTDVNALARDKKLSALCLMKKGHGLCQQGIDKFALRYDEFRGFGEEYVKN
jgi:hypothetical protein